MTRKAIIERTVKVINQLPESKAEEISDFADFIIKKYEEDNLAQAMRQMASNAQAFTFLEKEEDLYTINDLKEKY